MGKVIAALEKQARSFEAGRARRRVWRRRLGDGSLVLGRRGRAFRARTKHARSKPFLRTVATLLRVLDSSEVVPVRFGDPVRQGLLDGVNALADAVGVTLGPSARNVIIEHRTGALAPAATKDGATVAQAIEISGAMGRQL
jgi:hypothetical protein